MVRDRENPGQLERAPGEKSVSAPESGSAERKREKRGCASVMFSEHRETAFWLWSDPTGSTCFDLFCYI